MFVRIESVLTRLLQQTRPNVVHINQPVVFSKENVWIRTLARIILILLPCLSKTVKMFSIAPLHLINAGGQVVIAVKQELVQIVPIRPVMLNVLGS